MNTYCINEETEYEMRPTKVKARQVIILREGDDNNGEKLCEKANIALEPMDEGQFLVKDSDVARVREILNGAGYSEEEYY